TIHEILGLSISTAAQLAEIDGSVISSCQVSQNFLNEGGLRRLRGLGQSVEHANLAANAARDLWKSTKLLHPERFTVEEACDLALRASSAFLDLAEARSALVAYGIPIDTPNQSLERLSARLQAAELLPESIRDLLPPFLERHGLARQLSDFI